MKLLVLIALAAMCAAARAASPVLVELFTAEGCSSCPPADAFLAQLDATQPIPGAQLIVLSEHVDYWNRGGWTDPFSSAQFTERQGAYERSLGVREAYTPQFIVDGSAQMRLTDRQQIAPVLNKAAASPKISVQLSAVRVESGSVSGHVEVAGADVVRKADVYVGLALDHVQSKVLRGENHGQLLSHVGVLQGLAAIGAVLPAQTADLDFRVPLKAGIDPGNVRVVVFVQEANLGKVLGAALQRTAIEKPSAQSQRSAQPER